MTVDLSNANFETTPIMNAGRWKTVRMVAHHISGYSLLPVFALDSCPDGLQPVGLPS